MSNPNFPQGPGQNPGYQQNPGSGQNQGWGQNPGWGQNQGLGQNPISGHPFAGTPPAVTSNRAVPLLWAIVGTAVVTIVAAFLPWVTFGDATKMGTGGDGVFTLILGIVAGGVAVAANLVKTPKQNLAFIAAVATIVVGVLVTLVAIVDILDVQSRNSDRGALAEALDMQYSVAVGLWLTLIGGLALMVLGVLATLASRKRSNAPA